MHLKSRTWYLISLLLFGAAAWMWHHGEEVSARRSNKPTASAKPTPSAPLISASNTNAAVRRKSYRLSNTSETVAKLIRDDHAIILRNALIDTRRPVRLDIPAQLKAKGAPGSYIVQFDRPLNREFYDSIKKDGATYVSYIPNNAALVKVDADGAKQLEADPVFQAVLPYEPYYKLDATLLPGAVEQQAQTNLLSVTTFSGQRDAALKALNSLGAKLIAEDQTPFGPTLLVSAPPDSVAAIAQLPLAQEVESYSSRRTLNDLSRVQLGVSSDTLIGMSNYMNLNGSNIMVNMNDTGVDATVQDFNNASGVTRISGAINDYDGHGTHVAGIIAGNGYLSSSVSPPPPGSVANADFRGKATNVSIFVQSLDLNLGPGVSDAQLVQTASQQLGPTNLISNNSWGYSDSTSYDMHAAAYDAATRDAQPLVTGEQPLLFVFAAGDGGDGDDTGVDGLAGTITSPGTAKNVITVGATDTPRFITNEVTYDFLTTNEIFFGETDNSNLVAPFSSCGNVDSGTEGTFGRFKPDVVAPGVFIVSDRAHNYVDPTVATYIYLSIPIPAQSVSPGETNYYPVSDLPSDASEIVAYVSPNSLSPTPFPGLQLLADPTTPPTDIINGPGSNTLVINDFEGSTNWYIGVTVSGTNEVQPEAYDLIIYVLTTNTLGDYFTVLQEMNAKLGQNYLYQSGTSMSAGAISGVLALMQDFLRNDLLVTNPSPALMKAMLINGSRSLGLQYDFNAQTYGVNEQGWGMPNLTNCIPESLTNKGPSSTASMTFIDQSPTNALATGQSQTYVVNSTDPAISNNPIRFTLVWTDPPGDPAAGVALVNDLGLTVVDSTGTNVYIGNDFFSGDIFSEVNTGDAPDFINNVQNIYIDSTYAPINFPLSVTVSGYRINVNAVTTETNQIAQDYALVISSDDPALQSPMTVTPGVISNPPPVDIRLITVASNGVPLLHQRVGANEPNYYDYPIGQTNGNLQQWHFFIFNNIDVDNSTNTTTNVAFATFLPPNLSIPRNSQAGIDMYVSTNPALLTLDPVAVSNAYKEVGPGGTKSFVTNSTVTNWYIGIKSEDQQAADFGFYAVAQQAPFSVNNPDGSVTATGTALPVIVNDASEGGVGYLFAFLIDTANPDLILQNATVYLGVPFGNPSDTYGTLNHDGVSVVLNHHTGSGGGFTNTYDDLQENPQSGNIGTSGPGSLKNYIGQAGQGMWQLTETDNALYQNGEVVNFSVTAYPQPLGLGFTITLQPNTWYKDYVLVPNDATNMNIYLTYASQGGGPVGLYLTNVDNVQFGDYGTNSINPPGGFVGLSTNKPPIGPPLSGGPWFYGIYNYGPTAVTLNVLIQIQESLTPNLVQTFTNNTAIPLTTDGTTQSQICITSGQQIVDLNVGVRINDTNLDDLVLHLTSPQGTSVLLFENRGGLAATNLGLGSLGDSNLIYTVFTDDTNLTTTPIKFTPIFASNNAVTTNTIITSDSFDSVAAQTYTNGQTVGNWTVASNQVGVETEATVAHSGNNYLALTTGRITNTFTTIPGAAYELQYWVRGPGITDWWPADDNTDDIIGTDDATIPYSDVTYDVGEVERAFTFSGISPDNNNTGNEVDFGTEVGNFESSDFTVDFWIKQPAGASAIYGILEKRPQCNANVSMWCVRSGPVEGHPTTAPGALSLTVSDNNQVNHVYLNGSRLINDGIYHHAAFVRNGLTLSIYVDGVLDSSTVAPGIANIDNSVMFRAGQSICVPPSFGDPPDGSIPFVGDLDELDVYDRGLSAAEVYAINRAASLGKYNTNSLLPNFEVTIDGYSTNTIILTNFDGPWRLFTYSFIATNTQTTVELAGNTMSTLFDDIQVIKLPSTNYDNYYLPEEPLTPFIGEDPQGCWTLDVWDTRTDSLLTNNGTLLSWDLQLTSSSTNVNLIVLSNRVPYITGFVTNNSIAYFAFDVPLTANFATNILTNVTASAPGLNLLFNQSVLPTGGMPGDVELLTGIGSQGEHTLNTLGTLPPLVPGRRYFLGVQNTASTPATFTLEVNTDVGSSNTNIYALTNEVAVATNNINANGPEYYSFTVPTNAIMVTFQLLGTTNAELDLYARAGLPVPGPFNFDYESQNAGTNDQFIVITTNSEPVPLPIATTNTVVPLSPTTWYLSVYNPAGVANAGYTIVATYVTNVVANSLTNGALAVIPLTQTNSYTNTAVPGFPTNYLYSFTVTNNPAGVQFVVTNLSGFGNVELFVQQGTFPTPEQSYSGSFNPGTVRQLVEFGTNADLPSVKGTWYLAVPNDTPGTNTNSVLYSITASTLATVPNPVVPEFANGSVFEAAQQFSLTWTALPGQSYAVQVSTNLTSWSTVTTIVAQTNTISYTDSVPVSSQKSRFFRLSSP